MIPVAQKVQKSNNCVVWKRYYVFNWRQLKKLNVPMSDISPMHNIVGRLGV